MNKLKQTNTNGFDENQNLRISIIGGGLVGSMTALHLGRKGHDINVYEYRDDIRQSELIAGRSINLTLSSRGRRSLAEVGLEDELIKHAIPMCGRMLHDLHGNKTIVPYDRNTKQCIYSVGRKYLNEVLLTASEKYPNIHLNFNQKLVHSNLDEGILNFINPKTKEKTEVNTDLIIGCDGAFSNVRRQMLTKPGFDFSQKYIEHGYLELCIPSKNNQYAMEKNYLHIWPRGKFMMIALPNQDKTWTVTLFMPFENFKSLDTHDELLNFFQIYFPDSISLIGEERLIKDFFKSKPQALISVKCRPFHISSKVLLLGDAAHAIVPFYGQGMNAGFEDCFILSKILDKNHNNIGVALKEFSDKRCEDAHAISDLAMYNYIEMRDLVTRRSYRIRKYFDDFLFKLFPDTWLPLYNSISFSHMPYKKCQENREWQDKIITRSLFSIGGLLFGTLSLIGYRYLNEINSFNSTFS